MLGEMEAFNYLVALVTERGGVEAEEEQIVLEGIKLQGAVKYAKNMHETTLYMYLPDQSYPPV